MRNAILILLAFMVTRCATVQRGPMQRIDVDSSPRGASIELSECGAGSTKAATTPAVVVVNRRATRCTLRLTVAGYTPRSIALTRHALRRKWADPFDSMVTDDVEDPIVGTVMAATFAVWVISQSVDAVAASNYELVPSRVLVDFARSVGEDR